MEDNKGGEMIEVTELEAKVICLEIASKYSGNLQALLLAYSKLIGLITRKSA